MKNISLGFMIISAWTYACGQSVVGNQQTRSHTKATLQYSESKSIQVEYVNIYGNFHFHSNAVLNRTPFHNKTICFSGFTSNVKYVKENDSAGKMILRGVPVGFKAYFLEYRLDSFYLDSIMPDSTGSIVISFQAQGQKNQAFTVDCIKEKYHTSHTFFFSYVGEDGIGHITRDFGILNADKSITYHDPAKNDRSMDFLCFYGKSFRFVGDRELQKALREFKRPKLPVITTSRN